MRIGLFIETFNRDAGGAEKSLGQIADELVRRGHDVTICAGASSEPSVLASGVKVAAMGQRRLKSAWRFMRYRKWAEAWLNQPIDQGGFETTLSVTMAVAAHVVQPRSGTFVEALARNVAMRDTGVEKLGYRLGTQLNLKRQLLLQAEKQTVAHPRVKAFVAISDYVAQQFKTHLDVDPSRIQQIPNAAVVPDWSFQERQNIRSQTRQAWGLSEDTFVFIFPAMDAKRKGGFPLLKAFAQLPDQTPDGRRVALVLAGRMGSSMPQLAKELGLPSGQETTFSHPGKTVLWPGPVREMAAAYVASDVTVLPTYCDPASKVIIESVMLGVPAMTTIFNGSRDFVDCVTPPRGRVIGEPSDLDALTQAMAELMTPQNWQQAHQACTPDLIHRLSMKTHVDELEKVLMS